MKKENFLNDYPSLSSSNVLTRAEMDNALGGDCKGGCRENCKEGCSSGGRTTTISEPDDSEQGERPEEP